MGYFLGIDLGASRTVAAVAWAGEDGAEAVDLGDREGDGEGVASVLHLGADGALSVGVAARQWATAEPDRVVEGFPGRIGDDDPMLLAGEPWAPEELTAWLVRWVVDRVAEREGASADGVAVSRPPSWDDARTALLAAAVAEQDLDVRFLAPGPERPAGDVAGAAAQVGAASAVAVALRDAAGRDRPTATTASGRHAVVGGAVAALATVPAADPAPDTTRDDGGPAPQDDTPAEDGPEDDGAGHGGYDQPTRDRRSDHGVPDGPEDGSDGGPDDRAPEHRDVDADHRPDRGVEAGWDEDADRTGGADQGRDGDADQDAGQGPDAGGSAAASSVPWDVPAPRSHRSGAYDPVPADAADPDPDPDDAGGSGWTGSGGSGSDSREPGSDRPDGYGSDGRGPDDRGSGGTGGSGDPATTNLVAELLGFTGGMGATNTAGLLSGYTPPHGMPATWSGGPVAVAPAETETGTATGKALALPSQRASSGRWSAVAPETVGRPTAAPALRARNNPTVLVGVGGLAAAVAVVGTLFLWPAPRITNSATSRPIPAVPVATAAVEPTAATTVALTPEPPPTPRPRAAAPRPRRAVVPPVTVAPSVTETPSATGSPEPTEPTTSAPTTTQADETAPATTKPDDD